MANQILVTGATGTIGSKAVEGLLAKGVAVTILTRDAAKAAALQSKGAKVAVGSFEDPASMIKAFTGIDTLVLITASNEKAEPQTLAALAAAKEAKVRKIVRISALKADPNGPTDNTRQHGRTESALKASGLTYVILRPHLFMQNLFGSLKSIVGEGKIYWGCGDGKMGMIDTRDVSDAVVGAAISDAFDGQTLELTGPASISYHEVAHAVGRGLGREVVYVPIPPAAAGEAMRGWGADEWTVGIIRDYSTAYSENWGNFTSGEVQRLTGHAPRSIDDFVRELLVPATKR